MLRYVFSIAGDTAYSVVSTAALYYEICDSSIIIAIHEIATHEDTLSITFKSDLSNDDATTLSGIVAAHTGMYIQDSAPHMPDGRPIVRADTRPLDTETFFTMAGDTASGIGNGVSMMWDMDGDDDWVDNGDGYKKKKFELTFNNELYLKDGTIYFFNAPWGSWLNFYIGVPAGNYYPNPYGSIPASALGLPGDDMYSYADNDVLYRCYVNKHYMFGSCPMGDELNTEGASVEGLPIGWKLTGHVYAPVTASGSGFKGFASLESYRERTVVLPGDPLGPPTT